MEKNPGGSPAVNRAIYARDAQGDESSIDAQIRACKSYAERMGWSFENTLVFIDKGVSGATSTARPGLTALLEAAQREPRPFGRVLMTETSRLGRHMGDVLKLINRLKFHGVSITFVEQDLDSDFEGFSELLIGSTVGDAFVKSLSHAVRRSQKALVMNGFVPGGRRYGYDNIPVVYPARKVGGRPIVIGYKATINQAEAALVKRIFELRGQGLNLGRIALTLNAEAAPSPDNALRAWTASKVHAILNNPCYLGRLVYGRTRRLRNPDTGKAVARPQPQAEWMVREFPELRIVTDELWRKAQDRDEYRRAG